MVFRRDPAAVSPTAHYTAEVWSRAGWSHPALATMQGRILHGLLSPALEFSDAMGGPTLEQLLLARHRLIDLRLEAEIEAGRISQVLEVAAGLSPRGWRFAERFGADLTYIEADLPAMARRKRSVLADMRGGADSPSHQVVEMDAFAATGPASLEAVTAGLDPARGLAVISEGLLNYFDRDAVCGLWTRIAATFARFPAALYLSDLHLASENGGPLVQGFVQALSVFVRGRVHLHFDDARDAEAALAAAGFGSVALLQPRDFPGEVPGAESAGARRVRVIEARRAAAAAAEPRAGG